MASQRSLDRDMRRIAGLHIAASDVQTKIMSWVRLVEVREPSSKILHFIFEECTEPVDARPLYDLSQVSAAEANIFLNTNNCIAVVAWNTEWLARVTRGKHSSTNLHLYLMERNFAKPKSVRKTVMTTRHAPLPQKDFHHTVLVLQPWNGKDAIVSDPTYAQYSFSEGIESMRQYCSSKAYTHRGSEVVDIHNLREDSLVHDHPLGTAVRWQSIIDRTPSDRLKTSTIAAATWDIMIEEVAWRGGIEELMSLDDVKFQQTKDQICSVLEIELQMRRRQLEAILYH
ncbi:hypothetical protein E8E13_007054 [Curvularia kusanoi]|uniref:Uncharacterized protein n=1 Tax=Curvularia kusanoi TaxID=90978 RepID=A0A9P4WAL7_CURKU|nr:hypothetical protein E8E13_007054 [Curvularia kusanoi]